MKAPSTPTKNNPNQVAAEFSANTVASFATLMHRSVERLAGLQKATLDTLSTQSEDMNKTVRESLNVTSSNPMKSFFDLADQSLRGWITTQKTIVDLIVEQSAHVTSAAKERTMFTRPGEFFTDLIEESTGRMVNIDKSMLDYAAAQNKHVSEALRKQNGVAGTRLAAAAHSLEKNLGAVIDAQKGALDTAAKLPHTRKV